MARLIKGFRALCLCLFFATAVRAEDKKPIPTPLDMALSPQTLWATQPDSFVQDNGALGFEWISTAHDSAQTTLKGATLFGLPVCQTIVQTQEGKIGQATVFFYNRGDDGEITRSDYEALIRKTADAISAAAGVKFNPRGRDASSAVKAEGLIWNTEKTVYLLEYSFTKIPFRAEFVRLEITPRAKPKSLLAEAQEAREKAAPFRGPDHLVRDAASGDVRIKDIPMVDQGEKGYCVVASAERVLRYYGVRVDANELAQLANSSASKGTSVAAMTESLKKLTARFKIRVRTLAEINQRSIETLISDYNRVAKRAKASEIPPLAEESTLDGIYENMKPDLLREARTKSKSGMTSFERQVTTHIDKGLPLLWSVMFGIIPEGQHNQGIGGHMRLIIGYNEKSHEILYSDSWGIGHELKRMPLVDAWSMTTGLASIEPF